MNLNELGWNESFQSQITPEDSALTPARVYRQDLNRFLLIGESGELNAILPGRLRNEAVSKAELPTVGDWVMLSTQSDTFVIERTLDRFSKFSRKEAGDVMGEQVVAANIDTVFIVSGLDDNFNPGRIERYLLLCWNSGATPVIVLNKADLCENVQSKIGELQSIAAGVAIHILSALDPATVEQLRDYVDAGQTAALLGSSGVGKSTIINGLLGYDRFETGEVREGDGKGRHTTTYREMCKLESGGLIIDTPGMREIQIWADDASIQQTFSDVADFASDCKFTDCLHNAEPGCRVRDAIEKGELEETRLQSYRKFQRELSHMEAKFDSGTRAEKRKERKKFAKSLRGRVDKRDR